MEEHSFDGQGHGLELDEERAQLALQLGQALGQWVGEGAVVSTPMATARAHGALRLEHRIATARDPRIDTQHEHLYEGNGTGPEAGVDPLLAPGMLIRPRGAPFSPGLRCR